MFYTESKKQPSTKEQQSEQRLEKLRQWKKAKEETKKKENQARKPFVPVATKPSKVSTNIFINPKPWVASLPNIDKHSKPTQRAVKAGVAKTLVAKPSVAKPSVAKPSVVKPPSRPPIKSTRPPATKLVAKPANKITKKEQPVKTKEGGSSSKTVTKPRPQTRSVTKSVVSKVKADSKKSCSTRITARTSKANKNPPPNVKVLQKRTVTTRSRGATKVTTRESVEMIDISVEVNKGLSPPKTSRYDPVHPSPLLRCHSASAKRREARLFGQQPTITDPTWIPGQTNIAAFTQPDFEEAFNGFSPFKFGDSNSSFQFTFHKEYITEDDSLDSGSYQRPSTPGERPLTPGERPLTPDAGLIRRSLGNKGSCEPAKRIVCIEENNAMVVEILSEGECYQTCTIIGHVINMRNVVRLSNLLATCYYVLV